MITSGRCLATRAWRRSRWKYCAGVVRFATRMLPSAASCRKRSRRAGGVLRARALVAVREQQRQARRLAPLRQRRDDELVDDDLGRVDEVAELRLPEHERLRRLHRVAVLEAEAGDLRQRRVVQLHRRERARQALDRRDPLAGLGVVQDEVALGERAALGVLAGQADRRALATAARRRRAPRPAPSRCRRRARRVSRRRSSCLIELRVDGEALGDAQQVLVERAQPLGGDRGLDLGRRRAVELVAAGRLLGVGRGELLLELAVALGEVVPDLLGERRRPPPASPRPARRAGRRRARAPASSA